MYNNRYINVMSDTRMRIISKFQDFYDTAMAHGQDLTNIYSRHPKDLSPTPEGLKVITNEPLLGDKAKKRDWRYARSTSADSVARSWSVGQHFLCHAISVVFCGRIYRGIKITQIKAIEGVDVIDRGPYPYCPNGLFVATTNTFYDIASIDEYMATRQYTEKFSISKSSRWNDKPPRESMVHYFGMDVPTVIDACMDMKLPILVWDYVFPITGPSDIRHINPAKYMLQENVSLRDYQFYKIFDACTAYQELDMFVAGMYAPEGKPPVEVADKFKQQQHGFDCYSFKKGPTKNKPKICNRV
jgi:hypothetical protein